MNDVNFSACKFAADIVPYMYGELPAAESSVFESHLVDCGECTDEFAVIANARYEVYEWKKLEFEPLATPRFAVPYASTEEPAVTFSDKLRAAFSKGWAFPSLAFAMLAIVSVFSAVFLYSDDPGRYVADNDNRNSRSVVPEQVEKPAIADTPTVVRDDRPVDDGPVTQSVRPVPAATRSRTESKRAVRNIKLTPQRQVEVRSTSAQNQNPPRLNDFTDDEDSSLRLAELFEDIETSD